MLIKVSPVLREPPQPITSFRRVDLHANVMGLQELQADKHL